MTKPNFTPPNKQSQIISPNTCPKCSSWTVNRANYCWHCGLSLTHASHNPAIGQKNKSYHIKPKELMAQTGLLWGLSSFVCYMNDWYLSLSVIPPMALLAIPRLAPAWEAAWEVWFRIKDYEAPETQLIHVEDVEHSADYSRKNVLLLEFGQGTTMKHLAWIGKRLADGKSFSRPEMAEPGVLPQHRFNKIKKTCLKMNYALPINPKAANAGVVLTERGKRFFKKAYQEYGDKF